MPNDALKDLVGQFEKYDRMMRSENPLLELEIDKARTTMRGMGVTDQDISTLEEVVREPKKAPWKPAPPLPEHPLHFDPSPEQIGFFKELIRVVSDGATWEVPNTGHIYRIEKSKQQFVLVRDVELDPDRWHDKNKMILGLLGWKMVDKQESTRSFVALYKGWSLGVFDFNIDTQENPKTPGENFPPGTRGQDAVATRGTSLVRLGRESSARLWKHINALTIETGSGKTSAPWTQKP